MKLLILSDSHGYKRTLYDLIQNHLDCDVIIFLGDGENDFKGCITGFTEKIILQVRGNCDRNSYEPETIVREFGGVRFLITHGHELNVKCGLRWIIAEAKMQGCRAVLFGHTHRKLFEIKDGIALINSGSAENGSYCVVQVENGKMDILDK